MIDVVKIVTGMLHENCYIVHNGKDALIVDPGSESEKIINEIHSRNLSVKGILITHYHFDHVGALDDIKKEFNIGSVYDFHMNDDIVLGSFRFKIIHNPGHTKDSVSFYFDNNDVLFSGDFIFRENIGNFPIDEEDNMTKSLNIIKYLSTNVVIYPGHGEETTVEYELNNNPFLRGI